jgi:hypothetical protein
MFKIQLSNDKFYTSANGRVQHYKDETKAQKKIESLGEVAKGAKIVSCERAEPKANVTKAKKVKAAGGAKGKKADKVVEAAEPAAVPGTEVTPEVIAEAAAVPEVADQVVESAPAVGVTA